MHHRPVRLGESTFLRCMNARRRSAKARWWLTALPPDRTTDLNKMRESVGMVFQRFNLFPHMTVLKT